MARVTVDDCLKHVRNRFELVLVAAKRARQLMHGQEATVAWDNDKATVVALREIAAGNLRELPEYNLLPPADNKKAEPNKAAVQQDEASTG